MQPGRVSDEMRQRVLAAAEELGYQPNPHARSLLSGRNHAVALLVPDVTNPFYFGLIRGTQGQAKARGYRQVLVDTEASASVEAATIRDIAGSVDGLILAASKLSDAQLQETYTRIPIVLVNRDVPEVPSVVLDTPMGFMQAVEHLASFGHRSVVYIAGPSSSWTTRRRWRALQPVTRRLGITVQQLGPYSPTGEAGAAAAEAVLNTEATACLFFNDMQAIGALRRFAERGVRVPGDLSVVGSGDIYGADFCNPTLTTVVTPIEDAGRVATDILVGAIEAFDSPAGPPRVHEVLPTHLTVRESTGPAPTGRRPAP